MNIKNESKEEVKERRAKGRKEREGKFNRAKSWQLWLYPLNGLVGNSFMILMMLVSYYATGILGLGTVIVSFVITGTRIFDAVLDPIAGVLVDKTEGKYGKVRPILITGYCLMAISVGLLFFTGHLLPDGIRFIYFLLLYGLYIIGYTFYINASHVGNAILTNDPAQRPVLGILSMGYTTLFATGFSVLLSVFLAPRYGGFGQAGLFQELTIIVLILGAIVTGFVIFAIKEKDKSENFAIDKQKVIKFKDLWPILKANRPLQLFSLAAVTDKLSMQIAGNQIIAVILFGIIIGNFAMSGIMTSITLIPNILILLFGIRYAKRIGTKRAYVATTIGAIISYSLLILLFIFGNPSDISFNNIGIMTVSFVLLYVVSVAIRTLNTGLVQPMIPDIVDYEEYKTGRFAPGVVSAVYTFIDKLVSSLAQTIIGLILAFIGFTEVFPDLDTPLTPSLLYTGIFLAFGILIIGWIVSLIAMKFYPLDKETMEDIQEQLNERKEKVMS